MNHQTRSQVALGRLDTLESKLREALLAGRRAMKGDPPDKRVRQLRKDIRRRRARPCGMILEILLRDLEDGAPIADVLAFPTRLAGMLLAQRPAEIAPALAEAQQAETTAQAALDQAQMRLAYDKSESALLEVEHCSRAYDVAQTQLDAAVFAALYGPHAPGGASARIGPRARAA